MKFACSLGMVVCALLVPALAGGDGWTSDFPAAKKLAADGKMDLLLDFTGSDWCGWCIKLNKEVFQKDAFKQGVKDHFVLVEVDSPQDESKLSAETRKQNKELNEKYAVEGFPTIMLCDAEGRPYASAGYEEGGPRKYVAMLDDLRAGRARRDEGLAAAAKADGIAKARALAAVLDGMELEAGVVANFYQDVVAQIKAADPDDKTGFSKKLAGGKRFKAFEAALDELLSKDDADAALAFVDKSIKEGDFDSEQKLRMMMSRVEILEDAKKFDEALKTIDQAKAFAPDSPMLSDFQDLRQDIEEEKQQADKDAAKAKPVPAK